MVVDKIFKKKRSKRVLSLFSDEYCYEKNSYIEKVCRNSVTKGRKARSSGATASLNEPSSNSVGPKSLLVRSAALLIIWDNSCIPTFDSPRP